MKTYFLFLSFLLVFLSCEQEGELTRDPVQTTIDSQTAVLKYQGIFLPTSGINGSGTVKIYTENNQDKLVLTDYSITAGPDLKVYLSKTNAPNDFVNLGNLNAMTTYIIPTNINIKDYKFVLIHCQQYNHLFAIAEIINN